MEKIVNEINTNVESKKRWLYVFLGIIIMMCLGTVYSWSVFRISIEKIFDIGAAQSGLPYMISLASYAVFMLLTGKHLDKYSPRTIIFIGSLLVGGGWILSGFANNIYVLTCTYGLITGAGVGIVYGVPMTVAAKWFPEKKGLIVGLVLVGFGLSPFITAPIAGYLIETYGVMAAFKILGAAFIVLMPAVAYPLSYPVESGYESAGKIRGASAAAHGTSTSDMIKAKSFKGLYLSFMIGAMIGLMLIGMTSNVGIELIKLSKGKVVLLMSLFAVFNGVGRPTFGWITDRFSHKKAMLISYVLIIIASVFMLMAGDGSVMLYAAAFSIFWFNLGGWLAIAPTSTIAMYGAKHYSQNYGVIFTAYGIGAIIGVLASGMIKDAFSSYYAVFYFVIALCILGIVSSQKMIKVQ
ncbi:Sugar phosphate permease [Peptoclostridium litorale DSM 5388]|uniref:Oxalate:formate antiporter OxlT n=1 Tax=Peptoclostridium litorale DSM 5388 TaxID=1121324 RepID=A0A069RQT3_PEPLI|nr:OFA family MFS transporter [Peptoclostridium litorale]KDR96542.1 oxalate:formate antiporter OxlT [Peptoclostridium litorale DSM 5388]SIN69352.1 Sugar phosphate permease [Peptoclostridium litorale DSM 5388]